MLFVHLPTLTQPTLSVYSNLNFSLKMVTFIMFCIRLIKDFMDDNSGATRRPPGWNRRTDAKRKKVILRKKIVKGFGISKINSTLYCDWKAKANSCQMSPCTDTWKSRGKLLQRHYFVSLKIATVCLPEKVLFFLFSFSKKAKQFCVSALHLRGKRLFY
jgi:hypothetical protein